MPRLLSSRLYQVANQIKVCTPFQVEMARFLKTADRQPKPGELALDTKQNSGECREEEKTIEPSDLLVNKYSGVGGTTYLKGCCHT